MEDQEGEGKPWVAKDRILYLPALSGVSTLPLQGFGLELPSLTGVMLTTAQPWQQGPWRSPSQDSLRIMPLPLSPGFWLPHSPSGQPFLV